VVAGIVVPAIVGLGAGVFSLGVIKYVSVIGQNPTVTNGTRERQKFIDNKTVGISTTMTSGKTSNSILVLTTEITSYNKGQLIAIMAKNNGDKILVFFKICTWITDQRY